MKLKTALLSSLLCAILAAQVPQQQRPAGGNDADSLMARLQGHACRRVPCDL
jgi:hypothetical protein